MASFSTNHLFCPARVFLCSSLLSVVTRQLCIRYLKLQQKSTQIWQINEKIMESFRKITVLEAKWLRIWVLSKLSVVKGGQNVLFLWSAFLPPPLWFKKRKKKVDKTDLAEKAILNAPREYSRLLPFWTSNSKVNFNALRTVQAEGAVEDKVYKKKPERRKLI